MLYDLANQSRMRIIRLKRITINVIEIEAFNKRKIYEN